jgi:hypothetical protein
MLPAIIDDGLRCSATFHRSAEKPRTMAIVLVTLKRIALRLKARIVPLGGTYLVARTRTHCLEKINAPFSE